MAKQQQELAGGGRLLRFFGRGNSENGHAIGHDVPADHSNHHAEFTVEKEARRDLLNLIMALILDHDIVITPANIVTIHAGLSGSDLALGRKIGTRQMAGEKITQEWLDEISAKSDQLCDKKAELDLLMARLASGLEVFANTAKAARSASGSYHATLKDQAARIDAEGSTGLVLSSLADIAKAMMERTLQVEEQMRCSEEAANGLRKSLARAQREAEIDHLTGLPNRRAFEGVLETHYREAQREIEPLSVAICDIDHFKLVNDTHGHDAGDRVIQAVAQALARISNENCHVARHGGEEFVMLFRGMATGEALKLLDDARKNFATRNFVNRSSDEAIGHVTFSGGVANVFAYPDQREALKAADAALYRAKNEGRNRILVAEG